MPGLIAAAYCSLLQPCDGSAGPGDIIRQAAAMYASPACIAPCLPPWWPPCSWQAVSGVLHADSAVGSQEDNYSCEAYGHNSQDAVLLAYGMLILLVVDIMGEHCPRLSGAL